VIEFVLQGNLPQIFVLSAKASDEGNIQFSKYTVFTVYLLTVIATVFIFDILDISNVVCIAIHVGWDSGTIVFVGPFNIIE
jgi:hypothetical protein